MSHATIIKVVSVAPQLQRPSGGYAREPRRDTRHHVSGITGLTGRGVDDDNFDDDRSQPVRIATASTTQSTEPATTTPAGLSPMFMFMPVVFELLYTLFHSFGVLAFAPVYECIVHGAICV